MVQEHAHFTYNGNTVDLTFEKTGHTTANVEFDVTMFTGDTFHESTEKAREHVRTNAEATAATLISLVSTLLFNNDIKTFEDVSDFVENYSTEGINKEQFKQLIAKRMGIPAAPKQKGFNVDLVDTNGQRAHNVIKAKTIAEANKMIRDNIRENDGFYVFTERIANVDYLTAIKPIHFKIKALEY